MEAPKEFKELIGTKQILGGGLFSGDKETTPQEFEILDWRFGTAQIANLETMEPLHPTVELLVKNETMKRSRWTRGFPCRSIELSEQ